jgi:hypothetical protein
MQLLAMFLERSDPSAFTFSAAVTSQEQLLSLASELFELVSQYADCFASTSGRTNEKVFERVMLLQFQATEFVALLQDNAPELPAWLVFMATPAVAESLLMQMAAACSYLREQLAVSPSPTLSCTGKEPRAPRGKPKGKGKGQATSASSAGPACSSGGTGKRCVPKTFDELLLPPVGTSGAAVRLGQQAVDSVTKLLSKGAPLRVQVGITYHKAGLLLGSILSLVAILQEPESARYNGFLSPVCAVPTLQLMLEATALLVRREETQELAIEPLRSVALLLGLCDIAVWQGFMAASGALLLEVFWLMAEAAAVQSPDQHVPWSDHDICDEWMSLLVNLLLMLGTGASNGIRLQINSRRFTEGVRIEQTSMFLLYEPFRFFEAVVSA